MRNNLDSNTIHGCAAIIELANNNLKLIYQLLQSRLVGGIDNLYRINSLLLQLFHIKAGFRADQPRVPTGNPGGGQWAREPGAAEKMARALNHLRLHAGSGKEHLCGRYVANALRVGGIADIRQNAENFGPYLIASGFYVVEPRPLPSDQHKAGDIAVIHPWPGKISGGGHGHVQMYDGKVWISDFVQARPFWPGPGYAKHQPIYEIYRYPH